MAGRNEQNTTALPVVRVAPPHGTRARYVHRSLSCRCELCRKANARYIARHRAGVWAPRSFRQLSLDEVQ